MIEKWDIKKIDGVLTLLLQCGDGDAKLAHKKLAPYAKEPVHTSITPYNYRLSLTTENPDLISKIRDAVAEFAEESKKIIPFSPANLENASKSNGPVAPLEGTMFSISRDPQVIINTQYKDLTNFTSLDLSGEGDSLKLEPAQTLIKKPQITVSEDTQSFNSRDLFFDDPHTIRHPIEESENTVTDFEVNHDFAEQDAAEQSGAAPADFAEGETSDSDILPKVNAILSRAQDAQKDAPEINTGTSDKMNLADILSAKTTLDVYASTEIGKHKNPAAEPEDGVGEILAKTQQTAFNVFEESGQAPELGSGQDHAVDPFDALMQNGQDKAREQIVKKKVIKAEEPQDKEQLLIRPNAEEHKPLPVNDGGMQVVGGSIKPSVKEDAPLPEPQAEPAVKQDFAPADPFEDALDKVTGTTRREKLPVIDGHEKTAKGLTKSTIITAGISEVNVEKVDDKSEFIDPFDELEKHQQNNDFGDTFLEKFNNTAGSKQPEPAPQEEDLPQQQEEKPEEKLNGEKNMEDNKETQNINSQTNAEAEKENTMTTPPPPPSVLPKAPSAPQPPPVMKAAPNPQASLDKIDQLPQNPGDALPPAQEPQEVDVQDEPQKKRVSAPPPPDSTMTSATFKAQHSFYGARKPGEQSQIDHSIELADREKHNWPLEVPLVPTFTFESMVIGANRFAHATAISVIDNPGNLYNPLVLHGGTGTGKTHFLNAIGYALSKKFGQENIFMTNGVRFSRGIQRYVVEGKIDKFDEFISGVKAILIDDIHLTAVNEQNRDYISKYLNMFMKQGKQIVITSKYPPESLLKLEELIKFKLDAGWISELKIATGANHAKIVKKMLQDNDIDLSETEIDKFFKGMSLSVISRTIKRAKVLNTVLSTDGRQAPAFSVLFEKLLAVSGEDVESAISVKEFSQVTQVPNFGRGEWGKIGFFYPQDNANMMKWMAYSTGERAKELGIKGSFELALKSSYNPANIISSAFKIANICDNKKLKGAVILGPSTDVCDPSVRENFYDILTHMLEIMLIRCGIINFENIKSPSTYVKVIAELMK